MARGRNALRHRIQPPDRVDLLRSTLAFRGLDDANLRLLAQIGRWLWRDDGEVLFDEGDAGFEMYLIASGRVAIEKAYPGGAKFIAERTKPDLIGEMALFEGRPRFASAVCKSECLFLAISQTEFVQCVKRHPTVALGVIANLVDRLEESDTRAATAAGQDVLGRLTQFIIAEASLEDGIHIRRKPSDRVIAERIGSTRETVNRKLGELIDMGVISKSERGISILHFDKLSGLGSNGNNFSK